MKRFVNFREGLSPYYHFKYLAWKLFKWKKDLRVRIKSGQKLLIRQAPCRDTHVVHEVFAYKAYDPPEGVFLNGIKTIVDLGGHVGYTCLLWCHRFPSAKIIVFEPHPRHLEQIKKHLIINNLQNRVAVVPAAAGINDCEMFLVDDECESYLVKKASSHSLPVKVADWIQHISQPIDLLKIDIEGGERLLFSDERFKNLEIRNIVLEWHTSLENPDMDAWCRNRLGELGYRIFPGKMVSQEHKGFKIGVLWATKKTSSDVNALTERGDL